MVLRKLWRAGAVVCACLALGALCGFALPVPEEWLARDPGFSITCPSVQPEEQEGDVITVTPPVEDEMLSEGDITVLPAEPCPAPEEPLTAVFLLCDKMRSIPVIEVRAESPFPFFPFCGMMILLPLFFQYRRPLRKEGRPCSFT